MFNSEIKFHIGPFHAQVNQSNPQAANNSCVFTKSKDLPDLPFWLVSWFCKVNPTQYKTKDRTQSRPLFGPQHPLYPCPVGSGMYNKKK